MDNNTTLEINLNEEYKIKIENGNDFNKSIFKDVYESALKNVIEIVKQSDEEKSKYDDFNNIIAFTGERGKGKSSSMISFLDALVGKEKNEHSGFFKNENYQYINDKSFATIDIIDPSLFRGEESLFEIILAKMFQKFQSGLKQNSSVITQDDKRELIQHFQNVFENLQIINSDRKELYKKESIEALSKLATSSNLRACFKELIACYLKRFEDNKDYLVIAIDDFDLNISGAYDMLEDIRQFLIQQKIIILVACKIEQLDDSILNYLTNEFNNLSSFYNNEKRIKISNELENNRFPKLNQSISLNSDSDLVEKLKRTSVKYLEKLFPIHRRLVLPELYVTEKKLILYIGNSNDLVNISLEDISKNNDYQYLKSELIGKKLLYLGNDLSILLSNLIYSNSGLFVNIPKYRNNIIFPENLRSVLNFLSIFKKNNVNSELRRYLIDVSKNNLSKEFSEVFDILENQSLHTLNIALVNSLGNLKYKFNELNINYILFANNPSNVNIGDVFTVFRYLENQIKYTDKEQIIFIDLLNIYYSLRLIQLKSTDINLQSLYTSNSIPLFKISSNKKKRRDYVIFEGISIKSLFDRIELLEDKFWFINFFTIFGKYSNSYRDESNSPFFRPIQNVSNGVFSPLAIFSNILFPEELIKSLNIQNTEDVHLYGDIINWNLSNESLNPLFKNSMFFLELLDLFDKETRIEHKSEGMIKTEEGEEIYFDILFDYFNNSLEKALTTISKKYPFLNIDAKLWIKNNPILAYWQRLIIDNKRVGVFKTIFQDIYNAQDKKTYTKEELEIAKKLIKTYSDYFTKDQSNNSRGAKQAMNSVYKSFDTDSELFQKFKELRDHMEYDLIGGLQEIEKLLRSVK